MKMNTKKEFFSEIKDCVHNLYEVTRRNVTHSSIQKYVQMLSQAFEKYQNDFEVLEEIGKILALDGFLESFSCVWKNMNSGDENVYGRLPNTREAILMEMKEILWNYTDRSPFLCQQITVQKSLIKIILHELDSKELAVDKISQADKRRHVKANFGILHNVVRHETGTAKLIRELNGIDVILKFKRSEFYIIQAYVAILMAFCGKASEIEPEALKFMKDNLIEVALRSENHIHEQYFFSVHELLEAICEMALDDDNKRLLVDAGYLPLLEKILDITQFSTQEILCSLKTIFNLINNAYCKKKIGKTNITTKLHSLCNNPGCANEVKSKCNHVLEKQTTQKHIMISYQWDCQPLMIKVKDFLEANGYNVWIDIENMHGSLLSAMAQAVQQSSIVIAAISSKYQASAPCKREASFAHQRGIKILPVMVEKRFEASDWLGILIADILYVDLSHDDPSQNFPQLLQQLSLMDISP